MDKTAEPRHNRRISSRGAKGIMFVTNVEYLQKGIELGCANSILIKVNQIGINYI